MAGAVRVLVVGQAGELGIDVPPVIEREAQERVQRYAELAARDGHDRRQPPARPGDGWFCPPTVAADLRAGSPVLEEEIFGPLLAIERVRNMEQACDDRRRALPFALTGGLFSRDPATVRAMSATARRWATSTSIAGSPGRWSGASRSAATACRGREARPAGRITCTSSSSRGP